MSHRCTRRRLLALTAAAAVAWPSRRLVAAAQYGPVRVGKVAPASARPKCIASDAQDIAANALRQVARGPYCVSYEGGMVTLLRDHAPAAGREHGHATA